MQNVHASVKLAAQEAVINVNHVMVVNVLVVSAKI